MRNNWGIWGRTDIVVTDTSSYSDLVFELLQLLGFSYRPALADMPDRKMWRINPAADYGPLNGSNVPPGPNHRA